MSAPRKYSRAPSKKVYKKTSTYLSKYSSRAIPRTIAPRYARRSYSQSSLTQQIFRTSQIWDTTFQSGTAGNIGAGYQFYAGQLDQVAALVAIFDQYRFHKVVFTLNPRVTEAATTSTAPGTNLFTCIDYDDATNPSSIATMREYQSCKEYGPYEKIVRTIYPRVAASVYGGASFNQYQSSSAPWMDSSSTDARHYGFKILSSLGNYVQVWDIKIQMFIDWRMLH